MKYRCLKKDVTLRQYNRTVGGAYDQSTKHVSTSSTTERELFAEVQPRYLKAKKTEQQKILDEFTAVTRYHRKYAVRILKRGYKRGKSKRKGRSVIYRGLDQVHA